MHSKLMTILTSVLLCLPVAAKAYDQIYFFGDSLSDVGAFGGQIGFPDNARWTTANGPNWTNVLSRYYGLSSIANNPLNSRTSSTGNNYAQGGAQAQSSVVNVSIGPDDLAGGLAIQELPQQIGFYLQRTGGRADPNALYSVWIGGNDIGAAASNSATALQTISEAATVTTAQIKLLQTSGAKLIIVPNVPDLALTPSALYKTVAGVANAVGSSGGLSGAVLDSYINGAVQAAWQTLSSGPANQSNQTALIQQALAAANAAMGQPDAVTTLSTQYQATITGLQQLSNAYNSLVDNDLLHNNAQHGVIRPNISALISEISAQANRYGFSNITGSVCAQSAISCAAATYPASYVFTDGLHPTPAAHQIVGQYIYGVLQAPYFAAALPQSAFNNARQLGSALDGRYQALRSQNRNVGSISAFSNGAFNNDKVGYSNLSLKPKGQLYTLGIDYQASPSSSLGFAISRQLGKTDIEGGTPGSVNDRSTLLTALFSYQQNPFWLDADIHIGSGNLDTQRRVTLGPTQIVLPGSTSQNQYGLRLTSAYRLNMGSYSIGPVAGLDYASVKVAGFSEQGGNSSSMSFAEQTLSSLIGRVGWQLDADIGRFSPYARVSLAHEFRARDHSVTAGLVTTVGDFSINLGSPDANWQEWTLGTSAKFNQSISAYGQFTTISGRRSGSQSSGNIGVIFSF
ncbi:autotransporter domain-containing protein [Neisseriaceae bacterium TC5R-5]|nr:autotransporter domain-containing protein [Neisseriaceae bacterium TC5R-5]